MGTVVVGGVAAENFFGIDRLLNSPSANPVFQKDVAQLTQPEARLVLRYLSSELNRYYFMVWGWIEFALAVIILVLAVWLKHSRLIAGFAVMLAITAVMSFYITPEITQVGRALDFIPRQPPPPGLAEFGKLHGTYSILDLIKLAIGLWMAVVLARLRGRTALY